MADATTINYWAEVNGGFRSSVMLRLGAIALAAGVLASLGTELLAGPDGPDVNYVIGAWLLYILGLWIVGGAFVWIGANPFFSRFGIVVGAIHIIHGIQLLIVLFTMLPFMMPQIILTMARLLSLLFFAYLEAAWLTDRTRHWLNAAAGLQLAKVVLRGLDYLPAIGLPFEPLLDAVTLLFVASSLLQLASAVREEENRWAQEVYDVGPSDFADFNNPDHDWNKVPATDPQSTERDARD